MKKIYFLFIALSFYCYSSEPPFDGRVQRATYVLSLIPQGAIGAEIGVASGCFSYHVLLKKNPSKLYLIDPWIYGLQKDVELNRTLEKQQQRDIQYQTVCEYFAPFKNVEILRFKSEEAAVLFEDNYLDYVYIDGEHSYEAVMRDLTNYFPKIKVGGYLIGDDYGWTGIEPAVQDFLKAHKGFCKFGENPYQEKTGGQFVIKRIK
jgi:hypothetical protein